jgi:chromatin structure-remodeling complex subunit RSC1/2
VNVSQDPGPRHSLKYLHFLAHKRKEEEERMGGADRGAAKRARIEVPPTFTEQARQIFADIPMDT